MKCEQNKLWSSHLRTLDRFFFSLCPFPISDLDLTGGWKMWEAKIWELSLHRKKASFCILTGKPRSVYRSHLLFVLIFYRVKQGNNVGLVLDIPITHFHFFRNGYFIIFLSLGLAIKQVCASPFFPPLPPPQQQQQQTNKTNLSFTRLVNPFLMSNNLQFFDVCMSWFLKLIKNNKPNQKVKIADSLWRSFHAYLSGWEDPPRNLLVYGLHL